MITVADGWTLSEAVDWLKDCMDWMTEEEITRIASPEQTVLIAQLGQVASQILEQGSGEFPESLRPITR